MLESFMYHIYSHKDISFHELRKKRDLLILGEFFLNYYSENVKRERVVVFLTAVAICVEQLMLCVTYRVQKSYVTCHFF
jgi:hypothetical protein